jgi:hypothetical protein
VRGSGHDLDGAGARRDAVRKHSRRDGSRIASGEIALMKLMLRRPDAAQRSRPQSNAR